MPREWYRGIVFLFPTIFDEGWLYCDIFSFPTIFDDGVIISWHYIFTPDNIWWGGGYIVIFSILTIFGEGVIILWPYIFTLDNIWWGGDYIATLYFHSWQYLVRGWLYRDLISSFLTIFSEGGGGGGGGGLYRDLIFSLLTIFGEGVIISWPYIFTPHNIWWGGYYIVTLYFHSWRSPRIWHWRWLYFDIFTIQIWLCTLQWRHNGLDSVSNHQPHHCLLSRLFGRRSKKTSKLRVTGLRAGNSPGTGEFPAQMASYAENVSIWWRHHEWYQAFAIHVHIFTPWNLGVVLIIFKHDTLFAVDT